MHTDTRPPPHRVCSDIVFKACSILDLFRRWFQNHSDFYRPIFTKTNTLYFANRHFEKRFGKCNFPLAGGSKGKKNSEHSLAVDNLLKSFFLSLPYINLPSFGVHDFTWNCLNSKFEITSVTARQRKVRFQVNLFKHKITSLYSAAV